jgi:hypothetical protein
MAYDSAIVHADALPQIRRLILALLSFGLVALLGELLALGHDEDIKQWIPLVAITTTLVVIAWHATSQGAASAKALRIACVGLLFVGVTGIILHYRGNVEFQLEVSPELHGWALFRKALNAKAPPALAPGVMAQLGLLGLIYTFRHPALRSPADQLVSVKQER